MVGTPPKYAMQNRGSGQAMATSTAPVALPLDVQIGLLRQRVDQLTAELADLRSQMDSECVRQYWNGEVHFPASARIAISLNGNSITLDASGLSIGASGRIQINGSIIDLSAGALNGSMGMTKFDGVVQCTSLIANSVSAASYTPGAGNVW